MDQLLAAYPKDVRFVHKHLPLVQIHKHAMNAAKATVAADNQGKMWEMHDELYKIYTNLTLDEINKAATKLGLDMKRFETDMNSPETAKLIDDDVAVARAVGVTSTPTFFINGKIVTNRSFDGMKAMVEEELKKAKGSS